MKCEIGNLSVATSLLEVVITHREQTISFSAAVFGKKNFEREFDVDYSVFEQINKFWAYLPMHTQDEIFQKYSEINWLFNQYLARTELTLRLTDKVAELMDLHPFTMMYQWMFNNADINLPLQNFDTEYITSIDKPGNRERTYIKADYVNLIALAILLRVMVPIWGRYINHNKADTANAFKEFHAFKLLNKSQLLHCPAFEKLRIYIDHTVAGSEKNHAAILEGVSSVDYPTWLLALVAVKRLCIGDVRGLDTRANLVAVVHRFVTSKMSGSDVSPENTIKIKTEERGSSSEDTLSVLEAFRFKYPVSIGEVEELRLSVSNHRRFLHRLTNSKNYKLLDQCIRTSKILEQSMPKPAQIALLQWVMKPVISPGGIMHLEPHDIVRLFGVAEFVLWERGFPYLSLLLTSFTTPSTDEMQISGVGSFGAINKDLQNELNRLYPYQKTTGRKASLKETNYAITAIELVVNGLSDYTWTMSANMNQIQEVFGENATRRISLEHDIKNQLASLVVQLGNRNWNYSNEI